MSNELTFCEGRYESLKLLGRGAQGKLYLVRDRRDGIKKALKQIFNCDREIRREARILREVGESSCPHIVKYYDSFDETDFFNIVFEYHRFGDLSQLIKDEIHKGNKLIPSETILNWSRQLLEALDLIHSKNIIHRDVKPQNILISNFGNIILADFGVSVHPNTMNNTFTGTRNYISPEMLQGEAYGFATDIWSFGCVVYELFTLNMAFKGDQLFKKIVGCEIDFPSFENELY